MDLTRCTLSVDRTSKGTTPRRSTLVVCASGHDCRKRPLYHTSQLQFSVASQLNPFALPPPPPANTPSPPATMSLRSRSNAPKHPTQDPSPPPTSPPGDDVQVTTNTLQRLHRETSGKRQTVTNSPTKGAIAPQISNPPPATPSPPATMSLRSRSNAPKLPPQDPTPPPAPRVQPKRQALSQALTATAHLANLLPTGTLLAFQLLAPVFSNHGDCDGDPASRALTRGLLALLAASCFLASFTDSLRAPDGTVYYGLATARGLWLLDYPPGASPVAADLRRFRLRPVDFVHAALSVLVFGAVAMRDANVVACLFPRPGEGTRRAIAALPLGIGVVCSLLFAAFPTRRHGIGYPVSGGT